MALPANIRVNVKVPFPALVSGSGPITVNKANGRWTIGYQVASFQTQTPPLTSYPNDYVLVWDAIAGSFFKLPISVFAGLSGTRVQRSITGSGALPIQAGDSILNINAATDLTPTLPAYATRLGAPLTFKAIIGSHSQTITPAGTEPIDGLNAPYLLVGGASVTLVPFNDGVNAGWAVE